MLYHIFPSKALNCESSDLSTESKLTTRNLDIAAKGGQSVELHGMGRRALAVGRCQLGRATMSAWNK